jgi:hypothetical protein
LGKHLIWFGTNLMRIKYSKKALNIIPNVFIHCKDSYILEDFWNMTYFEIGSLNICLCNSTLQHLYGSYLNFPNFQMEYFKDILKIFQTNTQASKYGSYYPICICLNNGLGSFSTYGVGSWSLQVHYWESSTCIDLELFFNVYFLVGFHK